MNVVSTSPSGTEICYALGVEPVAVSHACDYPPDVENKPRINTSRIQSGTSGERHKQVRQVEADGHVYNIDIDRLRAAEPDVIISQMVCGVCAVDETLVDSALRDLDSDPTVIGLHARTLDDVFECIRDVGKVTNRTSRAETAIDSLQSRLIDISHSIESARDRPRTIVFEWMDPIYLGANWVPELVEIAGGRYDLIDPGDRSLETDWETVLDYDPEVIVITPCGFPVDRTLERVDELTTRTDWSSITAVRQGSVYVMAGSSYLTRWTPRLVDATERLAAMIHPTIAGPLADDVVPLETASPG